MGLYFWNGPKIISTCPKRIEAREDGNAVAVFLIGLSSSSVQ